MRISRTVQLLAPFCILGTGLIFSGVFDDVYQSDAEISSKKLAEHSSYTWTYVLLFLVGTCFYRILDGWRLQYQRKITTIDIYFTSVWSGLALLQLVAHYFIFTSYADPITNDVVIRRLTALTDWSVLPFFGWAVAWSRHVRRGWTSRHNWLAFLVPSLSYFLCLLHRSSFYFLLGIAVVLSCIAAYETYKIHFYRPQISPLFFSLVVLHVVFFATRCLDFAFQDLAWTWSYWHVISFSLITSLSNRMYLRILIEVNEHKH